MTNHFFSHRLLPTLALSVGLCFGGADLLSAQSRSPRSIFRAAAALDQRLAHRAEADVVRARRADLDVSVLQSAPGTLIDLPLFSNARFTARLEGIESPGPGRLIWKGRIVGGADGEVTFAVTDGVLAGQVTVAGTHYRLHRATDGSYTVEEVDPSALPDELPPVAPSADGTASDTPPPTAQSGTVAAGDAGTRIDVMVVYTSAALAAAGGVSAMHALIDLSISNTNTAYANSGVTQRVRLVHRGEVAYTESPSGMSADLSNLQAGSIADVHAMRNTYGADFVSLFTTSTTSCGIGYVMQTVSESFAPYAFNVTAWNCAAGNLTLAHELGHNMGLAHDAANSSFQAAYPYSYGYRDPGFFRTVMSYECERQGLQRCDRIAYFSSPDRTYNGRATGVTDAADNGRTLNNTLATTAAFRPAKDACTYALNPTSFNTGPGTASGTVGLTTQAGCPWTAASNSAFVDVSSVTTSAGPGTVMFVVAANDKTSSRSGTLTIGGLTFTVDQAGVVSSARARENARTDFNGDGRMDLLLRHAADGRMETWSMNGASRLSRQAVSPIVAELNWKIVGTGDLNGDGKPDLVWQEQRAGHLFVWFMDGSTRIGYSSFPGHETVGDLGWKIVSVADINNDGKADLIWREENQGWIAAWLLDGTTVTSIVYMNPGVVDTVWEIVGHGDFNGDGKTDLLWRHKTAGFIAAWMMNGVNRLDAVLLSPYQVDDVDWKIVSTGDLDGDGQTDLVWQHETRGWLFAWLMNGTTRVGSVSLTPYIVDHPSWKIVGPK